MQAALATLTLAQLQQYLAEGLDALHQLNTGTRVVRVRFADRWTEYHESDAARLQDYINQLTRAIQAKTDPSGRSGRHRPVYINL